MSYEDLYEINPSAAIDRLRALKIKDEYEGLTKEEKEEYRNLKEVFNETVDLKDEYFTF